MVRTPGRRKRGRRNRQNDFEEDQPRRTREIVDRRVVRAARQFGASREDFKDGGFACDKCAWKTKKRGFNGRQALRAHIKRHVRERRAIVRPLLAQLTVVLLAVMVYFFTPEAVALAAPTEVDVELVDDLTQFENAAKIAAVGVPSLLTLTLLAVAFRFAYSGRARTSRATTALLRLNGIMLVVAGVIASGVVAVPLWSGWLAGFLVLAVSNLYLAPSISRIRLNMARREYQPSGYSPLFMTGSAEVDEKLASFRSRLKSAIYRGDLNPQIEGNAFQKLLVSLGLGHVRTRPYRTDQRRTQKKRSGRRQR